jgi:ketosteroid isomerase-like protein
MKKRQVVVTLFILSSPAIAFCQASKQPSPAVASSKVESEIKDAILQRLDALNRGDMKSYLSYFADDCIFIVDNGAVMKPQAVIKGSAHEREHGIIERRDDPVEFRIRSFGDTAVASFRINYDEDWAGQKLYGSSRLTDVFARRGGRWLLVAHDEIPIPNARRVAVKVDPRVFDAYAGEYQLTPNFIVRVKREGDNLMEQWPGDVEFSADVPVSETTFVARGSGGESIYVKDASGRVTHFILRDASGDLIAKKIK